MKNNDQVKNSNNGERERMLTPAKLSNGSSGPSVSQGRPRPTRPQSESGGFNAMSLLASMRRVWPISLIIGLVLAPIFGLAGWMALAPKHSATGYLRIAMDEVPLAFKTIDQAGGGVVAFKVYKNTQKQILLSPDVLSKAVTEENISVLPSVVEAKKNGDPLQWLSKDVKVTFPDDGEVMAVELAAKSISDAKAIVDAIIGQYLIVAVDNKRAAETARIDKLNEALLATEQEILNLRKDIQKEADVLGGNDTEALNIKQQTLMQELGQLQAEKNKVNSELLEKQGQLEVIKLESEIAAEEERKRAEQVGGNPTPEEADLGVQISQLEIEQALSKDLEYQQLTAEAREVSRKIREMERASFGDRLIGPLLGEAQKIKSALEERRTAVTEMVKNDVELRASSGRLTQMEKTMSGFVKVDPQLERRLKLEVSVLSQRIKDLDRGLIKLKDEASKLGQSSSGIEMMRAKIQSLEELRTKLASERDASEIETKSDARITKISDAAAIEGNDSKKRLAATGAGALFGLFLPLIAFVTLDLQKKHLDDPKKIKSELHIDVLGMVPTSSGPVRMLDGPVTKRQSHQYANVVESVHSIVAMLVKKASVDERQIFMVSSAGPSEGKSTLAQNLWIGLCHANYRCLLIDMDFRRPSIHRNLNVDIGLGASDVLAGKIDADAAIRSVDQQRFFMTAGESRQLNVAALATDALPRFLDYLRGHYDFIIVDTAPILPVVDSRVIGEHVDGAVLSTIRDRSRLPQLVAAIELMKAHDTEIVGVVVNGFASGTYGYSYQRS